MGSGRPEGEALRNAMSYSIKSYVQNSSGSSDINVQATTGQSAGTTEVGRASVGPIGFICPHCHRLGVAPVTILSPRSRMGFVSRA